MPLCGGADPSRAAALSLTPIWIFHGAADPVVPVVGARRLVAAIRQAGGAPRYIEYEGEGHPIWDRVFADPELREWVFAQKRGATAPDPTP